MTKYKLYTTEDGIVPLTGLVIQLNYYKKSGLLKYIKQDFYNY